MAAVYGRQFRLLRSDIVRSFKETVMGSIITNTWLYIEGLDQINPGLILIIAINFYNLKI